MITGKVLFGRTQIHQVAEKRRVKIEEFCQVRKDRRLCVCMGGREKGEGGKGEGGEGGGGGGYSYK